MSSVKNTFQDALRETQISKQKLILIAGLLLCITAFLAYDFTMESSTNVMLSNSTELNYTEGNQLGTLIIHDRSIIFRRFQHPQYQACIYTSNELPPIILDIRTDETSLSGNTKRIDLTVDIPQEELSERDFNQTLSINQESRCRIRSDPSITVTEKSN